MRRGRAPGRCASAGFTLLETIVSISILAAMVAFLVVSFRLAGNSIEQGEAAAREMARLRAGIGVFERRTWPVYAAIVAGAASLFLLQLLVDNFFVLLPAAVIVSVLVLTFTKHELALEDTFPEILRLPLLGTFLRAKTPKPFTRRPR